LATDVWTHLAETFDGSVLRLYVNGALAGSVAQAGTLSTSIDPLQIGGDSIFGQQFAGVIDEVRVYNVALTPTQIQTDMNSPLGQSLPIVGLSSAALDFGANPTGTTSSPQTVVLTNIGGVPLNIGSIVVSGFNSLDFAQQTTCGPTVDPAGSCS